MATTIAIRDAFGYVREIPVSSVGTGGVYDDTGVVIYPDSLRLDSVVRDISGNIIEETRTDGFTSWKRIITRDVDGNVSSVSGWMRQ